MKVNNDPLASSTKAADVQEHVTRLRTEIAALDQRLKELKSQLPSPGLLPEITTEQPTRRELLHRAGLAAAGAAGGLALMAQPAVATQGSPVIAGQANSALGVTEIHVNGPPGATLTGLTALEGAGTGPVDVGVSGTANGSDPSTTGHFAIGVLGVSSGGVGVWGAAGDDGIGIYAGGGGRAPFGIAPDRSGAVGPPTAGIHLLGDFWLDANGVVWICIVGGDPGVFVPLQTGGSNLSHFAKVSHDQYTLAASDGSTWLDMDANKLKLTITPAFNAQAIISANADLWTEINGLNQDLGIHIAGGLYGAGIIVAWKESGGLAGTFSPNAAFLETSQPLVAGTAYTIKLRWKTNHATSGKIHSGAGPLPPGSGGGGVAGQFSQTRLAAFLVQDVPNPGVLRTNRPLKAPPPVLPRLPASKPAR